jgi:tetratricopeptide (TPR) repeat protein
MNALHVRSVYCSTLLLIVILIGSAAAFAQASDADTERGIALYQKHDYKQAKDLFQSITKANAENLLAWHYLALSLEASDNKEGARKAHEKAAKLGEALLVAGLKDYQAKDPLMPLVPRGAQIAAAGKSARAYLSLNSRLSHLDFEEWTNRAIMLEDYDELLKTNGTDQPVKSVFSSSQVTTKPRFVSKYEPQYTEEARASKTTGSVTLLVILAADGNVRGIVPMEVLPHGLTGAAVRAARQTNFVPAQIDGRPVSTITQIINNFEIH